MREKIAQFLGRSRPTSKVELPADEGADAEAARSPETAAAPEQGAGSDVAAKAETRDPTDEAAT